MNPVILDSLPFALGVVMLGLGLGLTVEDFRRVGQHPKAVAVALLCQVVLLPAICFGLVLAFRLPPELAIGLMLVAASPGGPTANLYSHLFGGNVALNVTLTATNSVLVVVTLPVVVNLSAEYFLADGAAIGLQFGKMLQVFTIVLVPVAVGMLLRARAPEVARRLNRPVQVLSVVVLLAVVAVVLVGQRANLADYFLSVGLAVLAFNIVSMLVGYGVPRLVDIDRPAAVAAGFEIGIHNTAIAVTVALSPALLDNAEMAIPGVVYGIVMHFTATAFGWSTTRRSARPARLSARPAAAGVTVPEQRGQSSARNLSARWAKR
ncbi:bile acid:sodium symporter family protein [Frankia sp. CNm7]|uniref:Bile acid:sodium symporter family protein n=1 Tax=Frankia nepalensis TaxID=1836974 RepID=A0A937UPU6_9ACTN|nr:bile acid:sodium symporter family protein [Frankia nepalensis]MBL7500479.1 bile acid:sodium symporter family protein [Frankia nepalensis]MBL7512831.1 bile acid:sodium symporter family protein [Frankia nepalensis]MBL7522522.1 bile acid:sodium symporter family protein [Frankia nepalensis]MBL7631229.1 bile acid:sodium symporter family protein [Frankia nepalensis]